jgi:hypothetical protein
MPEFVHVVRPNTFTTDRTYRLSDGAVAWENASGRDSLAFAAVERIRIHDAPMAFGPTLRRCVLRAGGKKLIVPSLHYRGVGSTEDRSASYAPFVRELVARIARANPNVRIIAGRTRAAQAVWIGLLIAILAAFALAIVLLVRGEAPWQGVFFVGIAIGFLPMTWRAARQPGARKVDADAIPAELLSD